MPPSNSDSNSQIIMPPSNSDSNSQFSLRRIDIKRSDGIDQIKFTYDDDTAWFAGHDGGKADARAAIMTQGQRGLCCLARRGSGFLLGRCLSARVGVAGGLWVVRAPTPRAAAPPARPPPAPPTNARSLHFKRCGARRRRNRIQRASFDEL